MLSSVCLYSPPLLLNAWCIKPYYVLSAHVHMEGGGGERRGREREGREIVVVFPNKSVSKLRQNPTSTIESAIHCIFNYFILHEGVQQSGFY